MRGGGLNTMLLIPGVACVVVALCTLVSTQETVLVKVDVVCEESWCTSRAQFTAEQNKRTLETRSAVGSRLCSGSIQF